MAANAFHHLLGSIEAHVLCGRSRLDNRVGNFSMRLYSKNYSVLTSVRASISHNSVDSIQSPLDQVSDSMTKSHETALILMRHGESMWNEKNLFTGNVDIPLTGKGVEEAIEGGKRIRNIPIDVIYTSSLIRAKMTVAIAMTQHRCKKIPIVLHNESEEAKSWSKIHNKDAMKQSVSVVTAWQLNERMYGNLQGLNKQEIAEKYGKEVVHAWRRTYPVCPPNGESLEMCAKRAVAYFRKHVEPELVSGKNVLLTAHANSLRSIIMYLDKLTAQEVINLELSTGIPMLYILKDGSFIRRGSPASPSESAVYAYTESLAIYRQKLDEVLD